MEDNGDDTSNLLLPPPSQVLITKASLLESLRKNDEHPRVLQVRILQFLEQRASPQHAPSHGWCQHPKLLVALLPTMKLIPDQATIQFFWRHRICSEMQKCIQCIDAYHYHISELIFPKLMKEYTYESSVLWMKSVRDEESFRIKQTLIEIHQNLKTVDYRRTLLKVAFYEWTKYERLWKESHLRSFWNTWLSCSDCQLFFDECKFPLEETIGGIAFHLAVPRFRMWAEKQLEERGSIHLGSVPCLVKVLNEWMVLLGGNWHLNTTYSELALKYISPLDPKSLNSALKELLKLKLQEQSNSAIIPDPHSIYDAILSVLQHCNLGALKALLDQVPRLISHLFVVLGRAVKDSPEVATYSDSLRRVLKIWRLLLHRVPELMLSDPSYDLNILATLCLSVPSWPPGVQLEILQIFPIFAKHNVSVSDNEFYAVYQQLLYKSPSLRSGINSPIKALQYMTIEAVCKIISTKFDDNIDKIPEALREEWIIKLALTAISAENVPLGLKEHCAETFSKVLMRHAEMFVDAFSMCFDEDFEIDPQVQNALSHTLLMPHYLLQILFGPKKQRSSTILENVKQLPVPLHKAMLSLVSIFGRIPITMGDVNSCKPNLLCLSLLNVGIKQAKLIHSIITQYLSSISKLKTLGTVKMKMFNVFPRLLFPCLISAQIVPHSTLQKLPSISSGPTPQSADQLLSTVSELNAGEVLLGIYDSFEIREGGYQYDLSFSTWSQRFWLLHSLFKKHGDNLCSWIEKNPLVICHEEVKTKDRALIDSVSDEEGCLIFPIASFRYYYWQFVLHILKYGRVAHRSNIMYEASMMNFLVCFMSSWSWLCPESNQPKRLIQDHSNWVPLFFEWLMDSETTTTIANMLFKVYLTKELLGSLYEALERNFQSKSVKKYKEILNLYQKKTAEVIKTLNPASRGDVEADEIPDNQTVIPGDKLSSETAPAADYTAPLVEIGLNKAKDDMAPATFNLAPFLVKVMQSCEERSTDLSAPPLTFADAAEYQRSFLELLCVETRAQIRQAKQAVSTTDTTIRELVLVTSEDDSSGEFSSLKFQYRSRKKGESVDSMEFYSKYDILLLKLNEHEIMGLVRNENVVESQSPPVIEVFSAGINDFDALSVWKSQLVTSITTSVREYTGLRGVQVLPVKMQKNLFSPPKSFQQDFCTLATRLSRALNEDDASAEVINGTLNEILNAPVTSQDVRAKPDVLKLTGKSLNLKNMELVKRLVEKFEKLLFDEVHAPKCIPEALWLALKNKYNISQIAAIKSVVSSLTEAQSKNKVISLLQGPPGTGKTSTILGIISAIKGIIPPETFYVAPVSDKDTTTAAATEKDKEKLETEKADQVQRSKRLHEISGGNSFLRKAPAIKQCLAAVEVHPEGKKSTVRRGRKMLRNYSSKAARAKSPKSASAVVSKRHILVCAPSNGAIDEIVSRLLQDNSLFGVDGSKYRASKIIRLGSCMDTTPQEVLDVSLSEVAEKITMQTPEGRHLQVLRATEQGLLAKMSGDIPEVITPSPKRPKNSIGRHMSLKDPPSARMKQLTKTRGLIKESLEKIKALRHSTSIQLLNEASIICSTLSACGCGLLEKMSHGFDCLIVDEAAQAVETSTLVALRHRCAHVVLVGDSKQLPATVLSSVAQKHLFNRSLFERLEACGVKKDVLTIQYRMHPSIRKFPSKKFYDNCLVEDPSVLERLQDPIYELPLVEPLLFFDLEHASESTKQSSKFNEREGGFAIDLVDMIYKKFPDANLGIITPYKEQVKYLRSSIHNRFGEYCKVEVNTVDGFQGREKDVIVFSCVRSSKKGNIGFLNDTRRLNVAITRARLSCLIIGNASTLERNSGIWKSLIQSAQSRNFYLKVKRGSSVKSLVESMTSKDGSIRGNLSDIIAANSANKLPKANKSGSFSRKRNASDFFGVAHGTENDKAFTSKKSTKYGRNAKKEKKSSANDIGWDSCSSNDFEIIMPPSALEKPNSTKPENTSTKHWKSSSTSRNLKSSKPQFTKKETKRQTFVTSSKSGWDSCSSNDAKKPPPLKRGKKRPAKIITENTASRGNSSLTTKGSNSGWDSSPEKKPKLSSSQKYGPKEVLPSRSTDSKVKNANTGWDSSPKKKCKASASQKYGPQEVLPRRSRAKATNTKATASQKYGPQEVLPHQSTEFKATGWDSSPEKKRQTSSRSNYSPKKALSHRSTEFKAKTADTGWESSPEKRSSSQKYAPKEGLHRRSTDSKAKNANTGWDSSPEKKSKPLTSQKYGPHDVAPHQSTDANKSYSFKQSNGFGHGNEGRKSNKNHKSRKDGRKKPSPSEKNKELKHREGGKDEKSSSKSEKTLKRNPTDPRLKRGLPKPAASTLVKEYVGWSSPSPEKR